MQKTNVKLEDVTQVVQDSTTKPFIATTSATKSVTEIFNLSIRDPPTRIKKNHRTENIISDLMEGIKMRGKPKKNY